MTWQAGGCRPLPPGPQALARRTGRPQVWMVLSCHHVTSKCLEVDMKTGGDVYGRDHMDGWHDL